MDEKHCLLFCDTFKHEAGEDMHLDMIGFTLPIVVSEIRVIPHGCKVHPEIRNRLGETNPSSFKLEIFSKNLSKPDATVFQRLGVLDYEEGKSIQLIITSKVATNVVLVRGWYRNLTVCLYGNFTNFQPDVNQVPPPPPMDAARSMDAHHMAASMQQVMTGPTLTAMPGMQPVFLPTPGMDGQAQPNAIPSHIDCVGYPLSESPQENSKRREHDSFHEYRRTPERWQNDYEERDRRRIRDNRDRFDGDSRNEIRNYYNRRNDETYHRDRDKDQYEEQRQKNEKGVPQERESGKNQGNKEELFEPLSPESDFFENSQDDNNSHKQKKTEQIGYEDIESDEDLMLEDFDFDEHNLQNDFDADDTWASVSLSFNPYQCSLSPLESISPITETEFEKLIKQYKNTIDMKEPSEVKQLQVYIVSDSEAERDTKWVTMLEELPSILSKAMAYLRSQASQKAKEKHFLSIITEWAIFGLNMDKARGLPLGVNIRFLKAGLKLTCLLANACDEYQRFLIEEKVQERLIELLKTDHMASSLKLSILKALDITTNTAYGMENFLGWSLEATNEGKHAQSIYEELILYLLNQPTVRVVASIKALLQKVHFYESLANLQSISERVSKSEVSELVEKSENRIEQEVEIEGGKQKRAVEVNISNKDMSDLLSAFDSIYNIISNGASLIAQPNLSSFPTSAKLQDDAIDDCYPAIVRLLASRRFLESISVLVSSVLFCDPVLYVAIRDILFLLLNSSKGLLYLSSEPSTCNGLIRVLLQSSESEIDVLEMPTLKQVSSATDATENCTPHQLGLLLVYHLQSLQAVDQLLETAQEDLEVAKMDSTDHISMLHTIYAMTFTPIGRDAVSSTFSQGDNLKCLLPFLTGDENFEAKMKKSVSSRYATVLLSQILLHADNVGYLKKFGSKLLTVPKKENDKTQDDIHTLLLPLEKITKLDIHAISSLLDFMKAELDEFKLGSGNLRSILTTLRLLKHLTKRPGNKEEQQKDLQWRLAVIQMFSANAIEVFITLFIKLGENLALLWKQNEPFTNSQCFILVNITMTLLELTDTLLSHSLTTSFGFKDVRLIQQLFVLHKVLCSKPPAGILSSVLANIQDGIIELLRKFMKFTSNAPESEEAVKSSTWYIVFKELSTFTVLKPENFITGLVLMSELLPTPLPIYSSQEFSGDQVSKIVSQRLFAMATFSCLGSEIKLMLKTVIGSYCSVMQYYLRRVTSQLVDLGSSVAGFIIRTLCEVVDEEISKASKESEENSSTEVDTKKRFLSGYARNASSLLTYLVCQPGGKASFLSLLSTTPESMSEFADFMAKIIAVKDKEADELYVRRTLLPMIQAICDHEACLDNFDGEITAQHLANSMPLKEHLTAIVSLLFGLLKTETVSLSVQLRALSILESLTDHDYGMQVLKKNLETDGESVRTFLDRLVKEVESKNDVPVIYNTISAFVDFLNLINAFGPDNYMKPEEDDVKMEEEERENKDTKMESDVSEEEKKKQNAKVPLQRSIFVNANMLKTIFSLDDKNTNEHPLTKLEKLIEEEGKDDEELVSLSQSITTLRMIMIATGDGKPTESHDKILELPPPGSVQHQFNLRLVSVLVNNIDDERVTANDWFDAPAPDDIDSDGENEAVKVDLLAISEKYLPNFKFKEEIEKGFIDTTEKRSKRSKRDAFIRTGDHIEDTKRLRFDVSALNTHPSFRGIGRGANRGMTKGFFGRGFNRGGRGFGRGFRGRGRGRGNDDGFRQRRQNTSRPPSMHVDDFINMEKTGDTVMTHDQNAGETNNTPTSGNDRYQNNFNNSTNSGGVQGRWSGQYSSNFRRQNEGSPQTSRNGGGSGGYDYNSRYGGSKYHNRSNSDWNNTSYGNRGSRDSSYPRSARGGGYWAGPKPKDDNRYDNRFFAGNNYRQNRGNRHQRTFTR